MVEIPPRPAVRKGPLLAGQNGDEIPRKLWHCTPVFLGGMRARQTRVAQSALPVAGHSNLCRGWPVGWFWLFRWSDRPRSS